ncbi:SDR family oxidoreductase [uncultured Desulfobacter sp.]|uniref:SDR family NAD(P)-dependent oxidoreductase n=1 Tax=uncultured Desulfobacter sp. TaxID=240139 RepID=UPI002AA9191D|nr:SDR family oxidoreductase [uncultured Desulfobacter sp.]
MDNTKTAVITGACGGIGKALAACFKGAGYFVVATDKNIKPDSGTKFDFYITVDLEKTVRDEKYAEDVFTTIKKECPKDSIHVLVNNAAVQILGGLDELSVNDWHSTMDVNLIAPFVWIKGLASELEKNQGAVINIGSIHARLTKKGFVAYATSKAAIAGMTRALAVDVGHRIRINAIEPAAIETQMLKAGFEGNEKGYEDLADFHPIGRIGKVEEVAGLALFLAGKDAGFTHGATIAVDGAIGSRLFDPV